MNLKKNLKKLFALTLSILTFATTVATVSAETSPQTFNATYYYNGNVPIASGAQGSYNVLKTTGGKYVYCTEYTDYPPVQAVTYTRGNVVTDNSMNYILSKAYNAKNDNENFIYKSALWIYLIDSGVSQGSLQYQLQDLKNKVNASNSAAATEIKNLVAEAKKAGANDTSAPTIKIDTNNVKFTLNSTKDYYESSAITITSSVSAYDVKLDNAPEGTTISKDGNKVYIKVPANKVTTEGVEVSLKANNSKDVYTSYIYTPNNAIYQNLAMPFKDTKTASATGTLKVVKEIENGGASISKQDITNKKELPGATLVVKDYDGNVIEQWVSTNEPHIIKDLKPGIYTLTETIAPEGYILSSETITFTVKEDGSITKVVMYNTPNSKEVPVENTASFKTITSSLLGTIIIIAGGYIIFKNSKKKELTK